jgi:hypothetical protein
MERACPLAAAFYYPSHVMSLGFYGTIAMEDTMAATARLIIQPA